MSNKFRREQLPNFLKGNSSSSNQDTGDWKVSGSWKYTIAELVQAGRKYKDLSFVWGVDRKIRPEDHCLASRGFPSDSRLWSQGTNFSTHDRFFFLHTFHFWSQIF